MEPGLEAGSRHQVV
ncbi:hypothetical protein D4764_13G0007580 [Takifugu flavidus]|uniref:Uncharacterized protein n=1 Tax=Takifugu flavidus TaxID=433684 RepID=A0A5C6PAA1_9TELE|nr:hypothetical protein D4764_13G0007580 [Takifugu flavidus]